MAELINEENSEELVSADQADAAIAEAVKKALAETNDEADSFEEEIAQERPL